MSFAGPGFVRLRRACLGVALAACLPLASRAAGDATGLSDPALLTRLSADVPKRPGTPVQVLVDESSYHFDAAGRLTRKTRLVYRIDSEDREDDWTQSSAEWQPWLQQRPEIEAQVIVPGGDVHRLDPATISESPVPSESPDMFTDDRVLKCPLPA